MSLSSSDYELVERVLVSVFREVFGELLVSLVLFGSYARREARPESDIDVLVVVEDRLSDRFEAQKLLDRVELRLYELLWPRLAPRGYRPVLSPHLLTRSQASVFRPIYIDLVFDARILYDKDGFMASILGRVRRVLEEVGVERRRIGRKWVVVLKPRGFRFGDRIRLEV